MKKRSIFSGAVFCFVLMISMMGCVKPVTNGLNDRQGAGVTNPDLARVAILLPTAPDARARGASLESAINFTNYFEVFFRRTDVVPNVIHSASAMAADGKIEVEIPAGTYDILLIAGRKEGDSNSTHLALASSYELDREIVLGPVNQVHMELATFDVNIIAPDSVNVAETFTVGVEIYTRNPLIQPGPIGGLDSWGGNTVWLGTEMETSPNLWVASTSVTAPLIPTESSLCLQNTVLLLFGSHDWQWWITIDVRSNWIWPEALVSYFTRPINFISGQVMPEVEIIITWPDN